MTTLSLSNVSYSYKCFGVLNGVSASLQSGQLVFVMGRNGAGKSTLFNCILKVCLGYGGSIKVNDCEVGQLTSTDIAKFVAYVPQNNNRQLDFSVQDIVLMGTVNSIGTFSLPSNVQHEAADKALDTIGIRHLRNRTFSHLSGGEQQLCLIARAIAQGTKILIMDEPCANLDYGNKLRVVSKLQQLSKLGYLVIVSSHDVLEASMFADNVLLLDNGTIIASGSAKQVLTSSAINQLYGVDVQTVEIGDNQVFIPTEAIHDKVK